MSYFILLLIAAYQSGAASAMQSNSTCAQMPEDRRQLVCLCDKQLQLRCVFNLDIKEVGANLDKTLRPIYLNEVFIFCLIYLIKIFSEIRVKRFFDRKVSIQRSMNPDAHSDVNAVFASRMQMSDAAHSLYLYFPDFVMMNSPFIRITFLKFLYVPSFAFVDKAKLISQQDNGVEESFAQLKKISSLVFELNDVYDFGIDKYAYFGVESESLLIEGPFNKLTIHQDAFEHSNIEELVVGCYCLDCESFIGDCLVKFGAPSVRKTFPNSNANLL